MHTEDKHANSPDINSGSCDAEAVMVDRSTLYHSQIQCGAEF